MDSFGAAQSDSRNPGYLLNVGLVHCTLDVEAPAT